MGRHRGAGLGGGHDEREQTLNQMLSEMDGFETAEGIVILAATNRPDILDPALLRPGRFDRQVVVPLPEFDERKAILEVHARDKRIGPDVDLATMAKATPGMSGADLANLVNEAALIAVRRGSKQVDRIDFEGNSKTRDKVLRREFLIQEGRIFGSTAMEQSILRLNQLGLFEEIKEEDYEVLPDEQTSLVNINVKVKEKSQQSIGFTAGVSGISGSYIGLNYSTNNFMGRGESLDFSLQGGTRTTYYSVAFTEPYLLDSPWNMGLQVFKRRQRYDTYNTYGITDYLTGEPFELYTRHSTGTQLSLRRRIGRSLWSGGFGYSFQSIQITDIDESLGNNLVSQIAGSTSYDGILRSEFTPSASYNSTNHYFSPSKGTSLQLSVGISGSVFGGDYNMIQPTVQLRHFFPDRWLSHGHNVFGLQLIGQYVQAYNDSSVPFYERFYMGGENQIRGFDIRSIMPYVIVNTPLYDQSGNPLIDPNTGLAMSKPNLSPVGGDTMGLLNFEYRIPIAGPLAMALFYDMGVVRITRKESLGNFGASTVEVIDEINNKIRGSVGVEIQFTLPVVNTPFRLIFARNPQRLDKTITVGNTPLRFSEAASDIKFTIGRSF